MVPTPHISFISSTPHPRSHEPIALVAWEEASITFAGDSRPNGVPPTRKMWKLDMSSILESRSYRGKPYSLRVLAQPRMKIWRGTALETNVDSVPVFPPPLPYHSHHYSPPRFCLYPFPSLKPGSFFSVGPTANEKFKCR